MKSIVEIKKIKFTSFVKLWISVTFSFGITIGILLFVLSLFGGNVYANLGSMHFTGISAGIINIFLAPVAISISSIIFSLLAYLPFKFVTMYMFKSIKLRGDFNFIEEDTNKNNDD